MMDLVTYEAPLNNSFQKDRLELVNKGSLGRRRKPSRSNLKNLLSPSNNSLQSTPSPPAPLTKEIVVNGDVRKENNFNRNSRFKLHIESSLPRTTESNYVLEAKQFSVEAKIKRKKSDLGKSAVLIQTWERRTQWDNFTKQQQASKNRFQNKENLPVSEHASAMPDSYICSKYKGSLQNGESLKKSEWVPSVRDVNSSEAMVRRVSENGHRITKHLNVNGETKAPNQEPEWISLSRKLCAKFVEGHIEHHSADSYRQEEPEGVRSEKISSPPLERKRNSEPPPREEQKKKKVVDTTVPENDTEEPQWIHLSRKLCTKFIEEHIEHPVILSDHFVPKPELVEPNGDVRIIEKIGKPRTRRSKHKKEAEPEWVSLSRKLRAKFIESHIDDPDTISLENQLNASDPEETSSESLSDTSQEIVVEKKAYTAPKPSENKATDSNHKEEQKKDPPAPENDFLHRNRSSLLFPEKECCWEYQEMEFDQESNSGTYQEIESCDGASNEDVLLQEARVRRGSLPQDHSDDRERCTDNRSGNITFADLENSKTLQATECYNNDVNFGNNFASDTTRPVSCGNQKQDKLFTIQFIARPESNLKNKQSEDKPDSSCPAKKPNDSFFNLSTWEEAHYKPAGETVDQENENSYLDSNLKKNFRSKSLDDICDSKKEIFLVNDKSPKPKENKQPECFNNVLISKENLTYKSEEVLHKTECNESPQNQLNDFGKGNKVAIKVKQDKNTDGMYADIIRKKCNPVDDQKIGKEVSANCTAPNIVDNITKNSNLKSSEASDHKNSKHEGSYKCNGFIPNSKYNDLKPSSSQALTSNKNLTSNGHSQTSKLGMSKWINISKSEQALCKNEYANVSSQLEERVMNKKMVDTPKRYNSSYELQHSALPREVRNDSFVEDKKQRGNNQKISPKVAESYASKNGTTSSSSSSTKDSLQFRNHEQYDRNRVKMKSKSLCDVSSVNTSMAENKLSSSNLERLNGSYADVSSNSRASALPKIEFQDFDLGVEIPLCAKLVSNQHKLQTKRNPSSMSSSSNRNESPCSESSHVYEDMFKETTSCPSDSETSSWTVMKNNSYYVNGRSSSMNDLDFSDSCSLSVKCDYASSCSDRSTLQSRHSSCGSSSFYVNLRDYDSHMLEPSLSKKKKDNRKSVSNGNINKISKSNPPTPESLRHLFTSPLSSIHTPPIRNSRIVNRIPPEPHQSHYYSTAAATSSAFKLGFDPPPQKPKKTERSSSIKIKDIAHGIILTFRRFQNHSKNSHVSPTHYVDVSHLAEFGSKTNNSSESSKSKAKKVQDKNHWGQNGKTDSDSGCHLAPPDAQRAKARRSSSDLTGMRSGLDVVSHDKKKNKNSKKNNREKKKNRNKTTEARTVPTVSRKVQQMADGTLYLVTTVSGDTALPGVYSDSPDTSSELSCHRPTKIAGESNC